MKRLITAILLLILILVACAGAYFYVSRTAGTLEQSVAAVETHAQTDDLVAARQAMDKSYAAWKQHYEALSALVRHNEIDDTERLFQRARQALKNDDRDEALMQLNELRAMLRHLPEMEQPRYSNLI